MDIWLSLGLVMAFIIIGGIFAGTELALVSLRDSQIEQLSKRGGRGALVARVARDPNRFLAAVQVGVTVAGFLSAAYGASAVAPAVAPWFERIGFSEGAAQTTALIVMTLIIAYLSLVFGELVPKRIALQRSSAIALLVTPALDAFARVMRPVIALLSFSTNVVVRLLGGDPHATSEEMTEEELKDLVVERDSLPADERKILSDVFAAREHTIAEVMQPRHAVEFLPGSMTIPDAVQHISTSSYSRFPVIGDSFDDVLGFVHVRDVLLADFATLAGDDDAGAHPIAPCVAPASTVGQLVRRIAVLPSTNELLPSMAMLRKARIHIALVVDEYGGTDGIVTLEDLVEELIGEIDDEFDVARQATAAGSEVVTLDGGTNLEDAAAATGLALEDLEDDGGYETIGGFVMDRLGRVASVGDHVPVGGYVIEVAQTEGNRIVALRITPPVTEPGA